MFFVTFATHIWRLKRSLECYHFSGRQLSYKCFGHTRLSSFCSFLYREFQKKSERGTRTIVELWSLLSLPKERIFKFFLGDSTLGHYGLLNFWYISGNEPSILIKNDNFCNFLLQKREKDRMAKNDAFQSVEIQNNNGIWSPYTGVVAKNGELTTNVLFQFLRVFW